MPCVNASGPSKRTRKPSRTAAGRPPPNWPRASGTVPETPGTTIPTCNGSPGHRIAPDKRRASDYPCSEPVRQDTKSAIHPAGTNCRGYGQVLSQGRTHGGRLLFLFHRRQEERRSPADCRGVSYSDQSSSGDRLCMSCGLQRRESESRGRHGQREVCKA